MFDQDWLRGQFFGPQPPATGQCEHPDADMAELSARARRLGEELLGADGSGDGIGTALDDLAAPALAALQGLTGPYAANGTGGLALERVLGQGALPPLLECDAKSYVTSLAAQDPRLAEHLRTTSGIDAPGQQINNFSASGPRTHLHRVNGSFG